MKRNILLLFMVVILSGCGMKVRIQGVDVGWFKERDWKKIAVGAVVSVATHELAHYIVAKQRDANPEFNGPFEVVHQTDVWVSRAGFLAQIGVGTILNILPATKDSDFTLGWNAITSVELFTYPVRNRDIGDFEITGSDEWWLFTGASTLNTLWTVHNIGGE
jgi:hypothetical protein